MSIKRRLSLAIVFAQDTMARKRPKEGLL